jgi:hypothetical protein
MAAQIDDATTQFLATAIGDLQRDLRFAGVVEDLQLTAMPTGMRLTARIRVGERSVDVIADGENLVTAYAALRPEVAGVTLATTFLEYLEH